MTRGEQKKLDWSGSPFAFCKRGCLVSNSYSWIGDGYENMPDLYWTAAFPKAIPLRHS